MEYKPSSTVFLGDIILLEDSKREPLSSMQRASRKGQYPYYGAQGIVDYLSDYTFEGKRLLVAEDGENLRSRKLPIANSVDGRFRVNNHAHVLCETSKCNIDYLRFYLNSTDISAYITGSTQPKLSQASLLGMRLDLPPKEKQDAIVSFLAAIERKINLNTRLNGYLEELFNLVFKQLMNSADSSWSTASLLDIADYKNGLAMQKFRPDAEDKGLPVLKIRELGQGFCGSDAERCKSDIDDSVKIHDGDLIFSWSGTLLLDFWTGGNAGLNQHLFKVTSLAYPSWFYYGWTKHHLARFIMLAKDRATTMGHIKRSALAESEVVVPPKNTLAIQTQLMQPIVDQLILNKIETRKLAALRDSLLPKLMSGEIDVSKVNLAQLNSHLA